MYIRSSMYLAARANLSTLVQSGLPGVHFEFGSLHWVYSDTVPRENVLT